MECGSLSHNSGIARPLNQLGLFVWSNVHQLFCLLVRLPRKPITLSRG